MESRPKLNRNELFEYEAQSYPPSLSNDGKLNLPHKKVDIIACINPNPNSYTYESRDCIVLDGPAVVQSRSVKVVSTFDEFAANSFMPYITRLFRRTKRVDIVWDAYVENSLKQTTRDKRGTGVQRLVIGEVKLPNKFGDFLQNDENKKALFSFLGGKVAEINLPPEKEVFITNGEDVAVGSAHRMLASNHEEADTRMKVHVADASERGAKTIRHFDM